MADMSAFLATLAGQATEHNRIDPELYTRYGVKRGLRNADGTGVLVGLTEIGDVHGYIIDEKEKVPVEGKLFYRGIEIGDIVNGFQKERRHGFEEICYLLLFGVLPEAQALEHFQELLDDCRTLPAGFLEDMILKAPSRDIMNKLARSVLVSYSYDPNPDDICLENVLRQSIELIARMPTFAAYGYQALSHYHYNRSLFIHKPQRNLTTAENFLRMIRADSQHTKLEADVLDLCLVLHAEHGGGNNSTFTVHVVTSTDTDTYSAIAAGIGSLKGPKHGGANIKVQQMLEDVQAHVKDWSSEQEVTSYLVKILKKQAFDRTGLIYGMGHAVYTLSDPRAVILKRRAQALAKAKGKQDEYHLLELVEKLAPEAFSEVKGSDRKVISANVDFFSGFVYKLLDIPVELYAPLFAIARVPGWCAHRIEEIVSGGRIIRPAYKSVSDRRTYASLKSRKRRDG